MSELDEVVNNAEKEGLFGPVERQVIEQEFPNRPYVSLGDAIRASDYEAVVPFLRSDRFDVADRGDHSRTYLHEVSLSKMTSSQMCSVARELINKGVSVNASDDRRETPLHYAAKYGQHGLAEILVSNGADSSSSFNIENKLPWFYSDLLDPESKEKMANIMSEGLRSMLSNVRISDQQENRSHHHDSHHDSQPNWGQPMMNHNRNNYEANRREDFMPNLERNMDFEERGSCWTFPSTSRWEPDEKASSFWPDPQSFTNFNESQIAPIGPPKDRGSSGSRMIKPIGSELSRPNTNQFPDHPSDDSDTYDYENLHKLRYFPDFNTSTDNIWPENNQKTNPKDSKFEELSAEADNEKPVQKKEETNTHKISVGKQQTSVFSRALEDTRAEADRLDASRKIRIGGNSKMDEMIPKESSSIRDDERQKERFRKLCEQYRGKYQRLDSIRDLREKSIAVLHFSAESGFNMAINDAIAAGVDVNSRRNGKSALLRTIASDGKKVNLESARLLLKLGADTDFQDANGNTFLHLAVSAAHVSAVAAVLDCNPALDIKNKQNMTAWALAQTKRGSGNVDVVRNMLVKAWRGFKARRDGRETDVRSLDDSLISAANCGAQDQIRKLLSDSEIDVNEQSTKGYSALHCAASQGKIGIVRMLLNAGANPDLQTRDGCTPLILTGINTRAWPEVADALLKSGANPNLKDANGNTALHHAARNVHVRLVQLLCTRGADVSIRNKQGIQARGVKPWDGKRSWNSQERWNQEAKDAVKDVKNALQEAFNKQRKKAEEALAEMEARDRTERIKRRADIAREKEAQKESDGSPVIPSRLISEALKTPPPNGSSTPPSGRSSDPISQTISMASQISQVSAQIVQVNSSLIRLESEQNQATQREYARDNDVRQILQLCKQNSDRLSNLETQMSDLFREIQRQSQLLSRPDYMSQQGSYHPQ